MESPPARGRPRHLVAPSVRLKPNRGFKKMFRTIARALGLPRLSNSPKLASSTPPVEPSSPKNTIVPLSLDTPSVIVVGASQSRVPIDSPRTVECKALIGHAGHTQLLGLIFARLSTKDIRQLFRFLEEFCICPLWISPEDVETVFHSVHIVDDVGNVQ